MVEEDRGLITRLEILFAVWDVRLDLAFLLHHDASSHYFTYISLGFLKGGRLSWFLNFLFCVRPVTTSWPAEFSIGGLPSPLKYMYT